MMGVNNQNTESCLQKCDKLNKSDIVVQLLNLNRIMLQVINISYNRCSYYT